MNFITETHQLNQIIDHPISSSAEHPHPIFIDTEFIREKTYFAQLCLIQVMLDDETFLIDPLSPRIDLSTFWTWLQRPDLLKVFHAGRQDLEIIHQICGKIPLPVFDTQIAAMACGMGESVGFDTSVQIICHEQLNKSSRLSDWSHRPLSPQQLQYAAEDVIYLKKIFYNLWQQLSEQDRFSWLQEETNQLCDSSQYIVAPEDAWKRIKSRKAKPKQLAALKALAKARETHAQRNNIPRGKILRDDILLELAFQVPQSLEDISSMRGIPKDFEKTRLAADMVDEVNAILATPSTQWPQHQLSSLSKTEENALEIVKMLLTVISANHNVAPRLLATRDSLEAFVQKELRGSDVFPAPSLIHQGWRWDILGKAASSFLKGKTGLTYKNKRLHIVSIEEPLEQNQPPTLFTSEDTSQENI